MQQPLNTCSACYKADLVLSKRTSVTVSHRAFEKLVVKLDGILECPACREVFVPEGYDAAVDVAYADALRERVTAVLKRLDERGMDEYALETMLGLDAGEIESVLTNGSRADVVTKVLAAVAAAGQVLAVGDASPLDVLATYQKYLTVGVLLEQHEEEWRDWGHAHVGEDEKRSAQILVVAKFRNAAQASITRAKQRVQGQVRIEYVRGEVKVEPEPKPAFTHKDLYPSLYVVPPC